MLSKRTMKYLEKRDKAQEAREAQTKRDKDLRNNAPQCGLVDYSKIYSHYTVPVLISKEDRIEHSGTCLDYRKAITLCEKFGLESDKAALLHKAAQIVKEAQEAQEAKEAKAAQEAQEAGQAKRDFDRAEAKREAKREKWSKYCQNLQAKAAKIAQVKQNRGLDYLIEAGSAGKKIVKQIDLDSFINSR